MKRHPHPEREPDETPENYLQRSLNWLNEPDRRRLGDSHKAQMEQAIMEMKPRTARCGCGLDYVVRGQQ